MLSFLVFIEAHPRPTCRPSNFPKILSHQIFALSPTLSFHKSFSCNTYENLRKCCKQKTYSITKSFSCNTYKKRGGHILQAKSLSPSARFSTFGLVFEPSHLPYTLSSSVSSNSFACHSYENTRGVGVFFPFWNSACLATLQMSNGRYDLGYLLPTPVTSHESPVTSSRGASICLPPQEC
jgi:hypothetical protein